jgi:hypothetical protein
MRREAPLIPLKAQAPQTPPEARAAALLRAVADPRPLPEQAVVRVAARLHQPRVRHFRMARSWRLAWALGAVGVGSLAFAAATNTDWPARVASVLQKRLFHPDTHRSAPPAVLAQPDVLAPPEREPERTAEAPRDAPERRAPARHGGGVTRAVAESTASAPKSEEVVTSPAVGGATAQSSLGRETALLGEALRARRERDFVRALAALDTYDREFPNGQSRSDAAFSRIDTLLALDRRDKVLALLDGLEPPDLAALPHSNEMRVLHGELMAETGRCREAVNAFDSALSGSLSSAVEERAWYGRAVCAAKSGNVIDLSTATDAYLQRFPDGRHAAQVRTLQR